MRVELELIEQRRVRKAADPCYWREVRGQEAELPRRAEYKEVLS